MARLAVEGQPRTFATALERMIFTLALLRHLPLLTPLTTRVPVIPDLVELLACMTIHAQLGKVRAEHAAHWLETTGAAVFERANVPKRKVPFVPAVRLHASSILKECSKAV